ncbi:MAG TPA: hypothetical protein VMV96_02470 [Acidimicrobiales bacterium]|nr:hypothetical protein [Acidimicrobiales bacterium]
MATSVDEIHVTVVTVIPECGGGLLQSLGRWRAECRCDGLWPSRSLAHYRMVGENRSSGGFDGREGLVTMT